MYDIKNPLVDRQLLTTNVVDQIAFEWSCAKCSFEHKPFIFTVGQDAVAQAICAAHLVSHTRQPE